MGPLPAVQPLVGPQGVRVPQRLAAVAAEEHLPGVGEHVPPELPLVGEPALAVGAGEGLLPAVEALVVLEVPWTEHSASQAFTFRDRPEQGRGCVAIPF